MQNVEKVTMENNNAPFDTIVGEVIGRNIEEASSNITDYPCDKIACLEARTTAVREFLARDQEVPVLLIKTTDGELRWVEESKVTFI
jgi:hypothetical protein